MQLYVIEVKRILDNTVKQFSKRIFVMILSNYVIEYILSLSFRYYLLILYHMNSREAKN